MSPRSHSLTPFSLLRPEKIRWVSLLTPDQDPLQVIASKSLRKFLAKAETLCREANIVLSTSEMTEPLYQKWFHFYEQKMREQNHEVLATPEWFSQYDAKNTVYALFYHQGDDVIGGAVVIEAEEYISLAYKASERIDLSNAQGSNFGSILEFDFLRFAQDLRLKTGQQKLITSGQSRNAFGVVNTLGYLEFKLRFGYQPVRALNTTMVDTVPVNEDDQVLFFATENTENDDLASLTPYFGSSHSGSLPALTELQQRLPSLTIIEWK